MEKFIVANGCVIRVWSAESKREREKEKEDGRGERTIVLLHGYRQSMDVWRELSKELVKHGFRVVAIDLPGHGLSQMVGEESSMEFIADTLHSALIQLDVKRCLLIGHSLGGYVALEFMYKYSGMLAGLILLHSTANEDTAEKVEERLREIEIIQSGRADILASSIENSFAIQNRSRFEDLIEELAESSLFMEAEAMVATQRGMAARRDYNDMLQQCGVPVGFIFGRYDEKIPVEVAENIAAHHSGRTVVWLENSGHMGFVEQPEEVLSAIIDFSTNEVLW